MLSTGSQWWTWIVGQAFFEFTFLVLGEVWFMDLASINWNDISCWSIFQFAEGICFVNGLHGHCYCVLLSNINLMLNSHIFCAAYPIEIHIRITKTMLHGTLVVQLYAVIARYEIRTMIYWWKGGWVLININFFVGTMIDW